MYSLLFSFLISFFINFLLIRFLYLHINFSGDTELNGPQKIHTMIVSRAGGLGIFISVVISSFILLAEQYSEPLILSTIVMCFTPAFIIGFLEDIKKSISVNIRLFGVVLSVFLCCYSLSCWVTKVQIPGIDWLLSLPIISILFTVFGLTGLANAYNIIDGFNGLSSMTAMLVLLALSYVAFQVNDITLVTTSLIFFCSILGFFLWNYPKGLIFLGDGGAYFIGCVIGITSTLLTARNSTVSPWFVLLISIYPIFETLFSIWRRRIHQNKNPSLPDRLHLHSLIYKRLIRSNSIKSNEPNSYKDNAKTSFYLWMQSFLTIIPAIFWWDNHAVLQAFIVIFCIFYLLLYKMLIKFKISKILTNLMSISILLR
jgi:UDP-GlcNAc:undecaprenyl-phosphate GlcNAc-1-phosphate transferase